MLAITIGVSIKYALNNIHDHGLSRFSDNHAVRWLDNSCRGIYHSIVTVALDAGLTQARRKTFFIDMKLKHGRELTEKVFKRWLNAKPTFSEGFERIELPELHFQTIWATQPSPFGDVPFKERTHDYYAISHLKTGYPIIWNSLRNILLAQKSYSDLAETVFPKVKDHLQMEIHKRLPTLNAFPNSVAFGQYESGYNLDLLFSKILRFLLKQGDSPFLHRELSPKSALGFLQRSGKTNDSCWELIVDHVLLLRTRNEEDLLRLRESIYATMDDSNIQNDLNTVLSLPAYLESSFESFRIGVTDLINAVELNKPIDGTCDICDQLEKSI